MNKFLALAFGGTMLAGTWTCAVTTQSLAQTGAAKGTGKPLVKVTQSMPARDINFLPWYLADKKGFFAEEGLEVALPNMTTQVAIPALVSKQIEFGIGSSSARAAYQGAPLKVLMYMFTGWPLIAVATKDIKSYKDLSGKIIATSSVGGSDNLITRLLIEREKVTDYQLIPIGVPAARHTAMSAGQVHFTMIDPLTAYKLEKEGFNIIGSADDIHRVPSGGYAVHEDLLSQRQDVALAWLRATIKALLYIKSETAAAADFAVTELGLDRELSLKSLQYSARYIDEKDPGGSSEAALVQATADDFSQLKIAGDPKAMAIKVHDFTLLRQAQRQLGIKCTSGYQCP